MREVRAVARWSAVCRRVLRLSSHTKSGAHPSADLRHLPIGVVWCARLWQALPVSVDRKSVVTNWLAGIAGSFCMGLELTMLPDAGSRGRFYADMSVGVVSAGPEAEEAGRASAGSTSMLNPKIGFRSCQRQRSWTPTDTHGLQPTAADMD
eukprot:scaffold25864_cov140-Isochrysis_galbana.AAC.5